VAQWIELSLGLAGAAAGLDDDVIAALGWAGFTLDDDANRTGGPQITKGYGPSAWVIPTNEELVIARQARDVLTRALAHGANDYLVKLPGKEALLACIRRHAVPERSPEDRSTARRAADTEQTLDRTVLAAFREADPASSSGFVQRFIDR